MTDISRAPRLFVAPDLTAGADVPATEGQAHYLLHVMRRRAGDTLVLFNGRDGEWAATLAPKGKRDAAFAVTSQLRPQTAPPEVTLFFAPIKAARLETLIEKATELGVAALIPVITQHTVVNRVNVARLTAIATEAAEQCERLTVPRIADAATLESIADWQRAHAGVPVFVLDEAAARGGGSATPLPIALSRSKGPAAFVVGPEGGFSVDERARLGALVTTAVTLGPRILRAETAGIAALACWQAFCGDWHGDR